MFEPFKKARSEAKELVLAGINAAIAKGNPMKTGVNATKLAIAAFVVPYIFCMNPAMLLINTGVLQILQICVTSFVGIFGIAAALNGHLFKSINPIFRLLIGAAGIMMMDPAPVTDFIGVGLFVAVCAAQYLSAKKLAQA